MSGRSTLLLAGTGKQDRGTDEFISDFYCVRDC